MKTVNLKFVLNFGRYKGKTISHVSMHDASYIMWCIRKKIFCLSKLT